MAVYYLVVALVISIVNIAILQHLHSRKVGLVYSSIFSCITVALCGHFYLSISTNVPEAMLANKVAYFGSTFVPLFLFLGVLDFCQVRVKVWVTQLLLAFSAIVYAFAATIGFSDVYYITSTIELFQRYGATDFRAEYGWAHNLYNIELIGYLLAFISTLFFALFRNKNISYRNLSCLIIVGILGIMGFTISREMGLDMLAMPTVYVIVEWTLLIIIYSIRKYDIDGLVMGMQDQGNVNAYVSFTSCRKFITGNKQALEFLPELASIRVDQVLPNDTETGKAIHNILDQMAPGDSEKQVYINIGNKYFKCVVRHLKYSHSKDCYLIKIDDDTNTQNYIRLLAKHNEMLTQENAHIDEMREQMINGLINMLENRDVNTGTHLHRTGQGVRILTMNLRNDPSFHVSDDFCESVVRAAPMHDLGKIAIDDAILRKPGKFTEEEFNTMKTHSEKGAVIVEHLLEDFLSEDQVKIAKNIAHYHHERYDGSGYPAHLKGDEIPLEARIMAVADVYDALVSKRCYKESMSFDEAYKIIIDSMGTHFDPKLKQTFMNCREKLERYYSEALSSEK